MKCVKKVNFISVVQYSTLDSLKKKRHFDINILKIQNIATLTMGIEKNESDNMQRKYLSLLIDITNIINHYQNIGKVKILKIYFRIYFCALFIL